MVNTLDDLLEEIYSDNRVSISEYMQIRDFADEKMQVLINRFGKHNSLTAFQKSADVTMQLLQRSIIILKEKKVSDDEKIVIREALQAQIKYLQIGWELLEKLF